MTLRSRDCTATRRSKVVSLMLMKTSAKMGFDDVHDVKAIRGRLYARNMTVALT